MTAYSAAAEDYYEVTRMIFEVALVEEIMPVLRN
jgi:hypothetical protein